MQTHLCFPSAVPDDNVVTYLVFRSMTSGLLATFFDFLN